MCGGGKTRDGRMRGGMGLGTIARANIRRHPGRAALMLLGMAVAVASFVTVVSLVLSLRSTLDGQLARYGASLVVTPASPELSLDYGGVSVADAGSGEVPVLNASAVATIRSLPSAGRVAEAIPVLLQPVKAAGATYLALGTDIAASLRAKPWWRIEGASPQGPDQVLLGLDARNKLGLDPGETVNIAGQDYTVNGILWQTGGEEDGAIVMDRTELARLTGRGSDVNLIEVTAADSGSVEQLSREIAQALPTASVISVKKSLEFNAQANGALTKFGLAATLLIVAVSALIVSLTTLAAVRERQREIGVFRAVGYRQRDIWALLLTEALLLSVGAAVLGTGVGLAGAALGPRLAQGLTLRFAPSPLVVAGGILLALVLAVAATLYPASRAARLDPAAALKRV
jgi:putative ABC transport system permease protein